jgi:hypothetical protein
MAGGWAKQGGREYLAMRYKIWMTVIICGTLLVLASPISDYMYGKQLADLLIERKDFNNISLSTERMTGGYRFGCYALGAIMIGVGIIGGWREHGTGPSDFES